MERRAVCRTCVVFLVFACLSVAMAQELPHGFRLEPVVSGLTEPSAVAGTPDGRILIAERTTGNLLQVRYGRLAAAPLCSVSVNTTGQGGLLGVTVHPDFLDNHWVYLYYTDQASGKNKVTRYTVDAQGCSGATTILGDLGAGPSFLRNGGGMGFGPDGKLYVATGDVESPANGQDTGSLSGKVLRANDDGSVPADNPTGGSLVYAVGVRDGRGVTVSPAGQVYVSDAGDDAASQGDELHAAGAGGNLGWDTGGGDAPLVSWLPTVGVHGISAYTATLFPDLASDGKDNDHDAYGLDHYPGQARLDDNGAGSCIGSENNDGPCTTSAECVPTIPNEPSHFCEFRDDPAEYCPGGIAAGDDTCGSTGAAGIDEPDESFLNNVFTASDSGIQRAVVNGANLDQLSSWSTFLDSTAHGDCPTGWTDVMAGRDGFLYAVATNGGGTAGALYRVTHEGTPGPREVSPRDTYFPLTIGKTPIPNRFDLYWEDLREEAKQPRIVTALPDPSTELAPPEREYNVWKGTIGDWGSHVPPDTTPWVEGIAGNEVNGALRKRLVIVSEDAAYFLVSARHANIEGTLGTGATGERAGAQFEDMCITQLHLPPLFEWFKCGRDFTIPDAYGNLQSLYEHHRGQPILLDFSAVWCPPCHTEANVIENLYQDYVDRDVAILTVLMDEDSQSFDFDGRPTAAECRNWEDRPGAFPDHTFECWIDPNPTANQQAWPKYNKWGALPTNVLLDSGLHVVYTGGGYNESAIRQRLNEMLPPESCLH